MSREEFHKHLRSNFAPRLRGLGFTGSGCNFRRVANDTLHVINIQGNKCGGSCCVNLCIHPLCLPIEGADGLADPKKLKGYQCAFLRRLTPAKTSDKWWKHNGFFTSPSRIADDLIATYFKHGESYFNKFSTVDDLLDELSIDKLQAKTSIACTGMHMAIPKVALVAARIYSCRGEDELKKQYAQFGLDQIGGSIGLKELLREML